MDIFGDGLDDDFFPDEKSEKPDAVSSEASTPWSPPMCEPEWFSDPTKTGEFDSYPLNIKHFHANHLYSSGKYAEASSIFTEMLHLIPAGNHQIKREVMEGLARSLLKEGDLDQALTIAKLFESSCKSKLHIASYNILCAEIYRKKKDHNSELKHLQQAVMCHQLNYDLWLKVAECYGFLSGLDVLSTPLEFHHSTEEFTWYAAASLARVDILIRSIAGNAGYLKEKKCLKLQSELLPVITRLPESFLLKAREFLSCDVYNFAQQHQRDATEFVDLGSSANANKTSEEEEIETLNLSDRKDWFENHWFHFIDSLKKDLYSTLNNT